MKKTVVTLMKMQLTAVKFSRQSPVQTWILITSANHMPRAIGSFAAAGWSGIIPYPVDFQTPKTDYTNLWDISKGTSLMRQGLHEYAGLLVYYLSGRSAALLPD
jgi:uncharacterized SAM-binding protein YcdF (DUF218 family)